MIRKLLTCAMMVLICSCSSGGNKGNGNEGGESGNSGDPTNSTDTNEYVTLSDFDKRTLGFSSNDGLQVFTVVNPQAQGINTSAKCGLLTSKGGEWEFIYSDLLPRKIDFTKNGYKFKMKVLAPKAGASVYFKIEPGQSRESYPSFEITNVKTAKSGEWEELVFDFAQFRPENNIYQKIVILFDAGETASGEKWHFDDIRCPSDDLSDIALFKRYEGNPVLRYEGADNWRDSHIANVAILGPGESPDGVNWFLYARGSGHTGTSGNREEDYHDQIGLFTQQAVTFKPFGPWDEYQANPVIKHGTPGEYDARHLLDCAPVVGAGGDVYFYYLGKSTYTSPGVYAGQRSTDGGYTFTKFPQPVIDNTGCSDAIYHNGKYYLFTGGTRFDSRLNLHVFITPDPESIDGAEHHRVLDVGGGPANFDSYSVNGSRIFRLSGVDKWFMIYQGSATHFDFPDRFHVAYSDDLINWTKVQNDVPLFTRGKPGKWDQGGIWYGEIFEHNDMIYLYYEGWGCEKEVENRDVPYFAGGHSQTGGASASKIEFLGWCGL